MKRTLLYMVISGMLLMSSCLVSSLHPFYKAKDKIYEPAMLGSWIDSDSCIWVIEKNMVSEEFMGPEFPDSTYRLTYYEEEDMKGLFIVSVQPGTPCNVVKVYMPFSINKSALLNISYESLIQCYKRINTILGYRLTQKGKCEFIPNLKLRKETEIQIKHVG